MDDFTDEFGDYRYMSKWQVASSSQFEDLLSEQSPAFQPPNDSRDDIRNKIAILHVKRREIKSMTEQELKTIDDRLTALGDLLRLRPMTSQETDDITVEDGTRIDYVSTAFDWSTRMKTELARTFKIEDFKSCQLGTCNAVMAGRNVLCVMPTGGGKSLTYQLPAILSPGITLVISPLVSLIQDQIQNLKNIHVNATSLTRETTDEEARSTMRTLHIMANDSVTRAEGEIKLLYVTPERLAESQSLVSLLKQLREVNKFARIVIDEAHCLALMADFRQSYPALQIIPETFPSVPITALSATCPPGISQALLKTFKLRALTIGNNANSQGTVFFSAPLYRKNLLYKVLLKSGCSTIDKHIADIAKFIQTKHKDESGIVYCFSRKMAKEVADTLQKNHDIKTGVYHSTWGNKSDVHKQWREGKIKVVCATNAFGLGINKADVRFVIHHCMPKSIEQYYQESGRAGRDSEIADCILWYRPQDAMNVAGLASEELKDGASRFLAMLAFVHNLTGCRKIQFETYLNDPLIHDVQSKIKCGDCDNCLRSPDTIVSRDVTVEAWRILKIVKDYSRGGISFSKLVEFISKLKLGLRSDDEVKGSSGESGRWSRDDIERLIVFLFLTDYLQLHFYNTVHRGSQASLKLGNESRVLLDVPEDHLGQSDLGTAKGKQKGASPKRIICDFLVSQKLLRKRKREEEGLKRSQPAHLEGESGESGKKQGTKSKKQKKNGTAHNHRKAPRLGDQRNGLRPRSSLRQPVRVRDPYRHRVSDSNMYSMVDLNIPTMKRKRSEVFKQVESESEGEGENSNLKKQRREQKRRIVQYVGQNQRCQLRSLGVIELSCSEDEEVEKERTMKRVKRKDPGRKIKVRYVGKPPPRRQVPRPLMPKSVQNDVEDEDADMNIDVDVDVESTDTDTEFDDAGAITEYSVDRDVDTGTEIKIENDAVSFTNEDRDKDEKGKLHMERRTKEENNEENGNILTTSSLTNASFIYESKYFRNKFDFTSLWSSEGGIKAEEQRQEATGITDIAYGNDEGETQLDPETLDKLCFVAARTLRVGRSVYTQSWQSWRF